MYNLVAHVQKHTIHTPHTRSLVCVRVCKGGGTYFHLGGGGKDQKGHCNVKKGTNGVHADNYH